VFLLEEGIKGKWQEKNMLSAKINIPEPHATPLTA
jgi:hypothetical protein